MEFEKRVGLLISENQKLNSKLNEFMNEN